MTKEKMGKELTANHVMKDFLQITPLNPVNSARGCFFAPQMLPDFTFRPKKVRWYLARLRIG
jgi:hypothetical protein